jgi:NADPH:quinone reductase-like Zn-dependent oxidoreductase
MKAIILNEYGDPPTIECNDIQLPKPAQDEVLVKIAIAPINPSDLIFIGGKNPSARPLPSAPGFEGSGTVVESGGGDLADQLLNQNVACRAMPDRGGTWAEYVVTKADRCIPLLPHVSLEQGAMLLVNPMT